MEADLMAPMKQAGSRWGTILLATVFSLLLEYAVRGLPNLTESPLLFPLLAAAYLSYFTMVQDLVVRFRLGDRHLVGIAFFTGTVYVFLVSGLALVPPLVLGVNWLAILFLNLVWWAALQTLLGRYLAGRLLGNDGSLDPLSSAGWMVALAVQAGVILLFQLSGRIPPLTPVAVGVLILLLIGSASAVKFTLPPREEPFPVIRPNPVWDILAGASIIVFLACALMPAGDPAFMGPFPVNRTSLPVVVLWSLLVAVVMALHRLIRTGARHGRVDPLNP
ncbi:MAG: hypothetical protein LUQ58_03480 [Methanomicrobiales archaeon]|nr:hypothetical protein [Methanomicrobiales archaeon]MDD1646996.1 hypothetical protein [Methanomicrobiales archaeon]